MILTISLSDLILAVLPIIGIGLLFWAKTQTRLTVLETQQKETQAQKNKLFDKIDELHDEINVRFDKLQTIIFNKN